MVERLGAVQYKPCRTREEDITPKTWCRWWRSEVDPISPNPPKDTDGRCEDRRRGMRELQGRWPGLDWGRWEVGGGS